MRVFLTLLAVLGAGEALVLTLWTCPDDFGESLQSGDTFRAVAYDTSGVECVLGEVRSPRPGENTTRDVQCGNRDVWYVEVAPVGGGTSGWCVSLATLDGKQLYEHIHPQFWVDGDRSPPRTRSPTYVVEKANLTLEKVASIEGGGASVRVHSCSKRESPNLVLKARAYSVNGEACPKTGGEFSVPQRGGTVSNYLTCQFPLLQLSHIEVEIAGGADKDKFQWCCEVIRIAHYVMRYGNSTNNMVVDESDFPLRLLPDIERGYKDMEEGNSTITIDLLTCPQDKFSEGCARNVPVGVVTATANSRKGEECTSVTLQPTEWGDRLSMILECPFTVDEMYRVVLYPSSDTLWCVYNAEVADTKELLKHHGLDIFCVNGTKDRFFELSLPGRSTLSVVVQPPGKAKQLLSPLSPKGVTQTMNMVSLRKVPEAWKGEGFVAVAASELFAVEITCAKQDDRACEVYLAMNTTSAVVVTKLLNDGWDLERSAPEFKLDENERWGWLQGFRAVINPGESKELTTEVPQVMAVYTASFGRLCNELGCIKSKKDREAVTKISPQSCRCSRNGIF
eukprot:Sspe_Gene.55560::Locus_30550_Transcript_1_2_Confidence_0.750_Length_2126::g.55560::m.55560